MNDIPLILSLTIHLFADANDLKLCIFYLDSSFGGYLDCEEDYQYDPDSSNSGFMDSSYQVIKWQAFNVQKWTALTDSNLKDL